MRGYSKKLKRFICFIVILTAVDGEGVILLNYKRKNMFEKELDYNAVETQLAALSERSPQQAEELRKEFYDLPEEHRPNKALRIYHLYKIMRYYINGDTNAIRI
jgi:hypothetical protein